MKIVKSLFLLVLSLLFAVSAVTAQDLKLPTAVGDNMVLQQSTTVAVWGWAKAGAKVTVQASWMPAKSKGIKVEADKEGLWKADLQTPAATFTPQTLTVKSGKEQIDLHNILVGEVWLCSGQSNMQFKVKQTLDLRADLKAPMNEAIRLYNTGRIMAETPQTDVPESHWAVSNPTDLGEFSAVGYGFGKKLQEELNVPVGLVCASYGGTFIEGWMSKEVIMGDSRLAMDAASIKHKTWAGKEAQLYNANIYPLRNMTVAGVIWYQGCANVASKPRDYGHALEVLVNFWRTEFRNPDLPFYVVQIVPHTYSGDSGAQLRESQAAAVTKLTHAALVVTNDQQDIPGDIHPRYKAVIAARLAACALGEHYGKNVGEYRSPEYDKMSVEGNKVTVTFKNVPTALQVKGDKLIGFQIGAANATNARAIDFRLANAEVAADGRNVTVWANGVDTPVAVRYCYDEGVGNLFSKEGLPVTPFRSDRSFSKSAAPYVEPASQIEVDFSGTDYVMSKFVTGAQMWPNLKQTLSDVHPAEFEGFDMLTAPSVKNVVTAGGKITALADGRVYCIVRAGREMLTKYYKEGWRILTAAMVRAQRPDGALIATQYIAYKDVRKGDVAELPMVKDHYSVFVLAKKIHYTPTVAAAPAEPDNSSAE